MKRDKEYDVHHRKPKSRGGNSKLSNLVRVEKSKHIAYHKLFGNMQPKEIAAYLSEIWVDPAYELIAIRRKR